MLHVECGDVDELSGAAGRVGGELGREAGLGTTALYTVQFIISFLTMEYRNQTLQYFLGARGILHSTPEPVKSVQFGGMF